jgi:hypothetical protein
MRRPIVRGVITATVIATAALVAAGALGVAGAETSTTTTPATPATAPLRTVSVQGVASEPLDLAASAPAATAVYRQAMAAALGDGQAKAQFLAEKAAATLGPVQSISEGGGYIQCPEGEEYQGAQPDFGSGVSEVFGAASAPAAVRSPATPTAHKAPARKHKRHAAKKATAEPCTLFAQVAATYQLS